MNKFVELFKRYLKKIPIWIIIVCGVLGSIYLSIIILCLPFDLYWSGPKVIDLEDTNMQIIYGTSHNNNTEIRFINKLEQDTAKIRFKIIGIEAPQFFYIAGSDSIYVFDRRNNTVKEVDSGNFRVNIIDTSNISAMVKAPAIIDSLRATGKCYWIDCESQYIPYIANPDGKVLSKDKLLITH